MYLLGTDTFADLISGRDMVVRGWYEGTPPLSVHLSVVSIGVLLWSVEERAAAENRPTWRSLISHRQRELDDEGLLLPITIEITEMWAELRLRKTLSMMSAQAPSARIDSETCFIVATAIRHGLTLADRHRPLYDLLSTQYEEFKYENPYA